MDATTLSAVREKPDDSAGLSDSKDDVPQLPHLDNGLQREESEGSKIKAPLIDIPMKYRAGAFAFIVFFSTGPAFAEYTLGPLKSTIRKELNVNSESQPQPRRREGDKWADERRPV